MNKYLQSSLFATLCLLQATALLAEPTPLAMSLPEAEETLISVALQGKHQKYPAPERGLPPMKNGEYSYKVWLPKGYNAQKTRNWPCIFIVSPTGKAGMGPMREHLCAGAYIVVMLQEAAAGGLHRENFLSAHDDVVQRLRVASRLKFATGFAGGARIASLVVQYRPGFVGLFQQGAGFAFSKTSGQYFIANLPQSNFAIATSIGSGDSVSFEEWVKLFGSMPPAQWLPIITLEGHRWSSAPTASLAFMFIESMALAEGGVTADTKLLARNWIPRHISIIADLSQLEKIMHGERILKAAARQGLAGEIAAKTLREDLQKWRKEGDYEKELSAEKAWQALLRSSLKNKIPKPKRLKAFADFGEKYFGTKAAQKARIFEEGIKKNMQ
ncbi:MAG: hypothetical protein LBD01_03955 [Puniceicoccales bacterium]|jgi:hypothetical protein|nr:hypothetical protein [Puniceicoccales bacterium]